MDEESRERARLEAEERVRHRVDPDGSRWIKVYFGGGEHLRGWLEQCRELAGEENVRTEPVDPEGLSCFAESGEGLYRIWVREGSPGSGSEPG
jgi:hypothetical protein